MLACESRRPAAVLWLCAIFAVAPSASAQPRSPSSRSFEFTPADTTLLDEINEYDRQLTKKGLVFNDPDVQTYVEGIGRKLIADHGVPQKVEFRFRVLRDPMVNAFALANGSIYVTTGLLATLENESQLASVLGHEITHVVNRHTYLENRSIRKKVLTINILQGIAAGMPGGSTWGVAVSLGASMSSVILAGTVFGYSQDKEREADRYGYDLFSRAGYDTRAMARTFDLLDERLEFEPIESFYRTHPKLEERKKTTLALAGASPPRDVPADVEPEYLGRVAPAICANIEADLNSRRARTAVNRAARLAKWRPDEPKYQVLLGDAYRALGAKPAQPTADEQTRQGQSEHRNAYFKKTEQEEQAALAGKAEGVAAQTRNYAMAEKLYRRALDLNANYAEAHRGLGFLYEQQARPADAARAYRTYLETTAGTSLDRLRIERRLAQMQRLLPADGSIPK